MLTNALYRLSPLVESAPEPVIFEVLPKHARFIPSLIVPLVEPISSLFFGPKSVLSLVPGNGSKVNCWKSQRACIEGKSRNRAFLMLLEGLTDKVYPGCLKLPAPASFDNTPLNSAKISVMVIGDCSFGFTLFVFLQPFRSDPQRYIYEAY